MGGGSQYYAILLAHYLTARRDVFPEQYVVFCRPNQSSVVHQGYQWYTVILQDTQGSPWYCLRAKVLTCRSMLIRVRHNILIIELPGKYGYCNGIVRPCTQTEE